MDTLAPYPIPIQDPGPQGEVAPGIDQRNQLTNQGYETCANPSCSYMHAPGYADTQTCPSCGTTPEAAEGYYNEAQQQLFNPGGGTRSGLSLNGPGSQGELGEQIVQELKTLPGYGPITWWSDQYRSPLDGATGEWGIEVKTANVDNASYKMDPKPWEIEAKNEAGKLAGYKGILGVIVVLDFRRSLADIYVRPFPFPEDGGNTGLFWRASGPQGQQFKMIEEVPFTNPFMDPDHPAPTEIPF